MSITEKINDFLLRKVAKSKCQYLFAVPKRVLFDRIHELNEKIIKLETGIKETEKITHYLAKENNALKSQIEDRKGFNYEMAYKGLVKEFENLQSENKSVKKESELIASVFNNAERQNKQLKEQYKILTTQNIRLEAENKNYKDKEKVTELKKVNHNFSKKVNNNNRVLSR